MAPRHVALAVLVAALWGFNFVVIKVGLEDVPPLLLSSLRYALASLAVLVIAPRRSVPWRWIAAVGLIIGTVKFSLLFVGMDVGVPAGLASLVLQAQAFFTLLFAAVVLGERHGGVHDRDLRGATDPAPDPLARLRGPGAVGDALAHRRGRASRASSISRSSPP